MALTNAEKQKRWRDKRNALAGQALGIQALGGGGLRNPDPELAAKLEPYLEGLFLEGLKNSATASPQTVAHSVILLERILVEAGIVPQSQRAADPKGYARQARAKLARAIRPPFTTQ